MDVDMVEVADVDMDLVDVDKVVDVDGVVDLDLDMVEV